MKFWQKCGVWAEDASSAQVSILNVIENAVVARDKSSSIRHAKIKKKGMFHIRI